jgi:hypothetical protein
MFLLTNAAGASASAPTAVPGPGFELSARHIPTNLAPGHRGTIQIDVFNVGAANTQETTPVTVTDRLPPGVTAIDAGESRQNPYLEVENVSMGHQFWDCTGDGPGEAPKVTGAKVVTCRNDPTNMPTILGGAGNTNFPRVGVNGNAQLMISMQVAPGATDDSLHPGENRVTVAGGTAKTPASTTDPITISSAPSPFKFTNFDVWFSNADGTIDTQAGSHPYAAMFNFGISTFVEPSGEGGSGGEELRNVEVQLPPGIIGDPTAVQQCTRPDFLAKACPRESQVGIVRVETSSGFYTKLRMYNMVAPPGVPSELGFNYDGIPSYVDNYVRTGSDYGITSHAANTAQRKITFVNVILWGVPGDPSHDRWRTRAENPCTLQELTEAGDCARVPHPVEKPFLTLPTACDAAAPPKATVHANTWRQPDRIIERSIELHDSNGQPSGLTGCEHLGFGPTITTTTDTAKADTPAGLTVEVKPSVGGLSDVNGLSTADIQNTTVTLPEGFVINPGQAAGLLACQQTEASLKANDEVAVCPGASKVGVVEIETPLLPHSLKGDVYVLQSNPPDLKLLVTAVGEGVNLKLVGNVHLDEQNGRLTTKFDGTPELPFTNFRLSFSGGAQAALDTPTQCGLYTTTSDFNAWSSPFIADAFPTASFAITEGSGGGPCPSNPMPFAPSLTAGSTTDQAGGFTNFSLLLQRGDGQQRIERLQFKEPAGLAGLISQVTLCPEPQASQGTCPSASHIGHAVVASGPGPYPLVLPQPGAPELPIYLTGPYRGAPFGLSIVTPVIAGPFNLGTIVTRAKIEVDPHTAQITITTDPLPQIVKGVPTDLRSVNSIIDRPGFLFNPTNCTPAEFTGAATSAGGTATAPLSSHFGVGSCRELGFHPKVVVTTAARSSKRNGASLFFNIAYPKGALGRESWFNEAKFDLPKQIPARLTTIQKACLASVFETNPAGCPAGSLIGHATVHTQVLPVPLAGPVYFVSHGGAKFPDAVIVLQGDGVTVDLVGETFINGNTGVTSATFRNTPDVPFENIEVTIPAGPFSEFGANLPVKANGSFCGQKLVMPTLFKAQNGLEIHQNTTVGVAGCPKKAATRGQKLAAALRVCHRNHSKGKRQACERAARRRYGPVKKPKKQV